MAEPTWLESLDWEETCFEIPAFTKCTPADCREVSPRELFAKIPSLSLVLGIVLFPVV